MTRECQIAKREDTGANELSQRRIVPSRPAILGFTLIELLIVISVMAILAGMLLPVSGAASRRYKISRVTGELHQIATSIETYKMDVGSYPPDHESLKNQVISGDRFTIAKKDRYANRKDNPLYFQYAGESPLFYELSGATFQNGQFFVNRMHDVISPSLLKKTFGVSGIQNSARQPSDIPYRSAHLRPSQHKEWYTGSQNEDVELLVVPVKGATNLTQRVDGAAPVPNALNVWYYDSSSTNRQNRATFDLWAEIVVGRRTNIIGNWKE